MSVLICLVRILIPTIETQPFILGSFVVPGKELWDFIMGNHVHENPDMRFFAGGHSPLQLLGRLFGGSGSKSDQDFWLVPSGYVKHSY